MVACLVVAGLAALWPAWASADTADDARAAAERFARTGVETYVVDVERSCFCALVDGARVLRVFVTDGRITRVQGWTDPMRDPGASAESATVVFDTDRIPPEQRWVRHYVPLPRAYRTIDADSGRYDEARATFARRSGWPRSFRADPIAEAVDDEFTITWRHVPVDAATAGIPPAPRGQGELGASAGNGDVWRSAPTRRNIES